MTNIVKLNNIGDIYLTKQKMRSIFWVPWKRGRCFHGDNDSESQAVVYEDYLDTSLVTGESGNKDLAADCVGRLAIHAGACFRAGSSQTETLCVNGSSHITGALHGTVNVGADLVHTYNKDYLTGTLADS